MKRSRWLGVVGAFALILAACGDDDDGGSSSATTAAATTAAATTAGGSTGGDTNGDAAALDELIAEAQAEGGPVVWYTTGNALQTGAVAEAFEEKYGIAVEVFRAVSADLAQRYMAEAEAGAVAADLVQFSDAAFPLAAQEAGYMMRLDESDIPGFEDYPKEYLLNDGGSAITSIGHLGLGYNTELIPEDEAPKTWEELADPKWKDEILIVDPNSSLNYMSSWDHLIDKFGEDWARGVVANLRQLFESGGPMNEALAAGEGSIVVVVNNPSILGLEADGVPVTLIDAGYTINNTSVTAGVSVDSPSPAGGRLLAHFMMSPEGQTFYNSDLVGTSGPVVPEHQEALARGLNLVGPVDDERRALINEIFGN